MTRIKKAELIDKESIRIVLEDSGEEFSFVGDACWLLDKDELRSILNLWKNRVIPKRREFARLTDAEREAKVKELVGVEV